MTVAKSEEDTTTVMVQRYTPFAPSPRYRKWPMARHRLETVTRNEFGYYECPFECDKGHVRCVHRFLTTTSLAAHYFTSHESNPNRIYCGACRKRFQTFGQLKKHNMVVHVQPNTGACIDDSTEPMQVDSTTTYY